MQIPSWGLSSEALLRPLRPFRGHHWWNSTALQYSIKCTKIRGTFVVWDGIGRPKTIFGWLFGVCRSCQILFLGYPPLSSITIFFVKVGDFGPFSEGWQGTSKLPDQAHIWNHASFGMPLHLWSPVLMFPTLGKKFWPKFQNWSNFVIPPQCSTTLSVMPF